VIVVDASAVNAMLLREASAEAVIDALEDEEMFLAPSLVLYEVGNALATAARSGRISRDEALEFAETCAGLPWVLDTQTSRARYRATLALSVASGLTMYDAAFLEIAQLRSCPLVTLDRDLAKAARKLGVEVRPSAR